MRLWIVTIAVVTAFLCGYLLNNASPMVESPNSFYLISSNTQERPSPQDHIRESQIHVYKDYIVLDIPGAQWSAFADTNSMDPVIDTGSNAIQIAPKTTDDVKPGDIISYDSVLSGTVVIHRVVSTGSDKDGWYAVTKGDNNNVNDPEKVRFSMIKRVLVAVVY